MEDVKKMSFPFDKSYNSRYEEDEPPQWEENQPLTQKKKKSSTVDRLVKTVVKIEDWGDGVGHVCYGLLYWIWRKERFVQLNEVLG